MAKKSKAKKNSIFASSEKQARRAIQKLSFDSVRTEKNYEASLKLFCDFLKETKNGSLEDFSKDVAISYLEKRAQEVRQKTLDQDRNAIQALLKDKIERINSEIETELKSRAYTREQIELIIEHQNERNALATRIAADAGLRAHELFTLRKVEERAGSTAREYRKDRFNYRENVEIYTVQGKGGLVREVAISKELADELESRRISEPKIIYDRDVKYESLYDIGGGKSWSESFSRAAKSELGWSEGAHGLRHTYAQERVESLQEHGYFYQDALEIVSQEMGHFRPDITEVYLR